MATLASLQVAIDASRAEEGANRFLASLRKMRTESAAAVPGLARVGGGISSVGLDASRAGASLGRMSTEFKGARVAMLALGAASGFVTVQVGTRLVRAVAASAAEMVQLAAAQEEVDAKFQAVFKGEAPRVISELEGIADATGRSALKFKEYAAALQDTFVPMGLARERAADLSVQLVQLATDVASFQDKTEPDVVRDFQSALVGNTETVRKYGIVLTEARTRAEAYTSGLAEMGARLTESQKLQARLALIVQGTADAQGDAVRTAGSFTNQMRKLNDALFEVKVAVGERIKTELLDLIKRFGGVDAIVRSVGVGFNLVGDAAVSFIDSADGLAEALARATKEGAQLNTIVSGIIDTVDTFTPDVSGIIGLDTIRGLRDLAIDLAEKIEGVVAPDFDLRGDLARQLNAAADAADRLGPAANQVEAFIDAVQAFAIEGGQALFRASDFDAPPDPFENLPDPSRLKAFERAFRDAIKSQFPLLGELAERTERSIELIDTFGKSAESAFIQAREAARDLEDEQLNTFLEQRNQLMGQLNLTTEEQVFVVQNAQSALRFWIADLADAEKVSGFMADTLIDLSRRLERQEIASIRAAEALRRQRDAQERLNESIDRQSKITSFLDQQGSLTVELIRAQRDLGDSFALQRRELDEAAISYDRYLFQQVLSGQLNNDQANSLRAQSVEVQRLRDEYIDLQESLSRNAELIGAAEGAVVGLSQAVGGAAVGFGEFGDLASNAVRRVIADLIAARIQAILLSAIGNLFGPRAAPQAGDADFIGPLITGRFGVESPAIQTGRFGLESPAIQRGRFGLTSPPFTDTPAVRRMQFGSGFPEGLISSPTTFPLTDRTIGLVGEAGAPEVGFKEKGAVFPLAKTATGKVGIEGVGSAGGVNIGPVIFQLGPGSDFDSFRRNEDQIRRNLLDLIPRG